MEGILLVKGLESLLRLYQSSSWERLRFASKIFLLSFREFYLSFHRRNVQLQRRRCQQINLHFDDRQSFSHSFNRVGEHDLKLYFNFLLLHGTLQIPLLISIIPRTEKKGLKKSYLNLRTYYLVFP